MASVESRFRGKVYERMDFSLEPFELETRRKILGTISGVGTTCTTKERTFRPKDKADEDSEYIGSELPDSKAQRKRKMNMYEDSEYIGSELPDSKAKRTRKMALSAVMILLKDMIYHARSCPIMFSVFPHYERIWYMFIEDKAAVEQTLGQRKNYKDKRNQRDENKSFINLITNSSGILSLVTDTTGDVKFVDNLKSECLSAVGDIAVISMKEMSKLPKFVRPRKRRKLDKANDEMEMEMSDDDSFTSPIVFSVTDEMIKEWSSSELSYFQKFGIYIIPETSKSIRATICFLLERPIAEQLEDLLTQVKVKKADVINDYIAQLKTKRETRSTSGFMSKLKDQMEDERYLLLKYQPEMYCELTRPFDLLIDRLVSLQNELIRAPWSNEETPPVELPQRQITDSVKSFLMGKSEVVVFGYIHDVLEVWLEQSASQDRELSKDDFERQLREYLGEEEPYLIRSVKFSPAVNPGDKLYPTRDRRHFGTLGSFASSQEDVVGITIFHVINGTNETFVDGINQLVKLGDVAFPDDDDSNRERIAFVNIDAAMRDRVNMQLIKNGRKLTSRLFTENISLARIRQRVFKKGASTQWTNGIVTLDNQAPDGQGIVVVGAQFCQEGDSGSAIVRFSPPDPDDSHVEVISILSGEWQSREAEAVGTLSLQLRNPLERLGARRRTRYQLR